MQSNDVGKHLQRWTAISSLALLAATWRLWTPQTGYPQVPALQILCHAPAWFDWLCLSSLLFGLTCLTLLTDVRSVQIGCVIVLVSLLWLMALDQHRFQPWAYALCLVCVVWFCCHIDLRLRLFRWLLISIYFYSAISKLDFEFLHTVGQQMLAVVAHRLGIDITQVTMPLRLTLAATFPLIELAIAVSLMFPKTRRVAGWLAIAMHLALLAILGPLGLNHRLGVLIWNLQVAIQAYWLFIAKQTSVSQEAQSGVSNEQRMARPALQWMGIAVIGLAIALPSTERFGLWDHWPSWALYAPHSSRVRIAVAPTAVKRLPISLQSLVEIPVNADEFEVWLPVPIDKWSLQELDSPVYPQARFQIGVAEKLIQSVGSEFYVRISVFGSAARLTGIRRTLDCDDLAQLRNASKGYWLNSRPRHFN